MAKKEKKNDTYRVGTKAGAEIMGSVDVGLGQLGFVKMSLDKKPLVSAATPVGPQRVGTAADVKGKLLIVQTKVTDAILMTDKMSVVIRLTGGVSPKTIKVPAEVSEAGESVLLEVFVLFRE